MSVGLLLEDHERADDVQACLDHRRELPREDLQRLGLDLLERGARGDLAAGVQLVDPGGQQAADAQLLAGRRGSGACSSPVDSTPAELIALKA